MISTYLLTATILICSLSAFGQQSSTPSTQSNSPQLENSAWKLSFAPSANLVANDGSLKFLPPNDPISLASNEQVATDTVCYKIRSYVVARDSKDSDSVHPVGYSTCQPSSKYRLRTTDGIIQLKLSR